MAMIARDMMVGNPLLASTAEGRRQGLAVFSLASASRLDGVGALLFLGLALLGVLVAGSFFGNLAATPEEAHYTLFSAGSMPAANIGIGLKVASSLFLVFAAFALWRRTETDDEQAEEGEAP